ncbi:MAG: hypothetical protein RLZZ127_3352 [Planctomycetota bacterium]|jgi:transcription antitermination factor NusG
MVDVARALGPRWLVCRIDPRRYELWLGDCAAAGIEAYVPTVVEVVRPHRSRGSRHVFERTLPAFPGGYAFVREDGAGPALYRARGWRRFVLAAGDPVGLRPGVVDRMRRQEIVRHAEARAVPKRFKAGDEVRVVEHMWLGGVEGVVARDQTARSSVLVTVPGWHRPIELHPCVLESMAVHECPQPSDDGAEA